MVSKELGDELLDRYVGTVTRTGIAQQLTESLTLAFRDACELGQVDVDGFHRAEQRREPGAAERRVRVAVRRSVLDVREEAGVRLERGTLNSVLGVEPRCEPFDRRHEPLRHWRRQSVQCLDSGVNRVRPGLEMP